MNLRPVLAGLALGGILSACSPDTDKANQNAERYPTDTETGEPASPSPATTMAFVDQISALDLFFVEAGKLAALNGTSAAVKDYAAAMVKDHTATADSLEAVADKAQPAMPAPPKMTQEQLALLERLRAPNGNFDSAYARAQVSAHEAMVRTLRGYSAAGENAALRDFAEKAVAAEQAHLDKAHELPALEVAASQTPLR